MSWNLSLRVCVDRSWIFDLTTSKGKVIVEAGKRITARNIRQLEEAKTKRLKVPLDYLLGRSLAKDIIDTTTGELIAEANSEITEELVEILVNAGLESIETIYTNDLDCGPFISDTLKVDATRSQLDAQIEIYRCMRPGEPPTKDAAQALFNNLFFNLERYDLSAVGRMKMNRRLGRLSDEGPGTLTKQDILDVMQTLVGLKNGKGVIDDIDNLGNRRIRSVGELVENQFRIRIGQG